MANEATLSDLRAALSNIAERKLELGEQRRAVIVTMRLLGIPVGGEEAERGAYPSSEETARDLGALAASLEEEKLRVDELHNAVSLTLSYLEDAEPSPAPAADIRVLDAVAKMLESEDALHQSNINTRLDGMGIVVGGANPIMRIAEMLASDPRFEDLGDGVWRIAGGDAVPW